ncbi:DUF397 domain-containing protein [Streptomyces sp. NPDC016469]|uniref:DUF397 domain-containing protein n=1 Tax=Streptomyces sp. NPDC016469 TaxID=3157191 RepID=UPI0033CCDDF4
MGAWRDKGRPARGTGLSRTKPSYSGSEGGDCVEVAARPAAVHIRDSKVADGPMLTVPPAAWDAFLRANV